MPHVVRFSLGGSTLNLMDRELWVHEYFPDSPNLSTIDFTPDALRDGGERVKTTRRNVTETMTIVVGGSSASALEDRVRQIDSWMQHAEQYQEYKVGSPVYLEFQPDTSPSLWRSEILGGQLTFSQHTYSYEWRNRRIKANLHFTRRFYWEGPEMPIALATTGCVATTNGVPIYNFDNGGHLEWHRQQLAYWPHNNRYESEPVGLLLAILRSEYIEHQFTAISGCVTLTGSMVPGECQISVAPAPCAGRVDESGIGGIQFSATDKNGDGHLYRWDAATATYIWEGMVGYTSGSYLYVPSFRPVDGWPVTMSWVSENATRHSNWVGIAASAVPGALPAATRIDITNVGSEVYGTPVHRIYMGLNAFATAASSDYVLQGRDWTWHGGAFESLSSANYSEGEAIRLGMSSTSAQLAAWTIPASALAGFAANYHHVLARLPYRAGSPRIKLGLYWPPDTRATLLAETPEVLASSTLQYIGKLRLPPWRGQNAPTYSDLALVLSGRGPTVAGGNGAPVIPPHLDLDYLVIMPQDEWRILEPVGAGLGPWNTVIDDGIEGRTWMMSASTNVLTYVGLGNQIMLRPNQEQRLFFQWNMDSDSDEVGHHLEVRIYARPRKLTL